jgi:hypothetical protein
MTTTQKSISGKVALIVAIIALSVSSTYAGVHPAYLKALTDLRAARKLVQEDPKGGTRTPNELAAVNAINAAIQDVKKAASDDGKDLDKKPAVQDIVDRPGRLHLAVELLTRTRADINLVETNEVAKPFKASALADIDDALKYIKQDPMYKK